jgi:hypothetical protein
MWSDEINKKLEDAERSNRPAYNDKAWENMELLLDKHLPLKKKRRRFIFLLFSVVLGGAASFFILQNNNKQSQLLIEERNLPIKTSARPAGSPANITTDDLRGNNSANSEDSKNETGQPGQKKIITEEHIFPNLKANKTRGQNYKVAKSSKTATIHKSGWLQPNRGRKWVNNERQLNKNIVSRNQVRSGQPMVIDNSTSNKIADADIYNTTTVQQAIPHTNIHKTQENTILAATSEKIKKQKIKSPSGNRLGLTFSLGPDVSSVGVDDLGSVQLQCGIGLNYALSDRISIRTGFFAGPKKYTADSADYHLHYSIANLQKVDADCYVYEIPLTVVYNFPTTKKHNWYVSGGVSSYLMKKETYDYYYKNSWSQPQSYSRTYKNESSHLFSVINLSGGYRYHATDRLSIMAEPYIKIPTSGIGIGRVNLNGAGFLFTIGFKPFQKEK